MNDSSPIAFVGLGRMGANMARRLHERGYAIAALYDAHEPAARELARELAVPAVATLAAVTAAATTIVTAVSDDAAMATIFAEAGDTLLENVGGRTFVNCATVSPAVARDVERRVRARGAEALEACMAGSIPQARGGTLYLIAAGDRPVFERVEPLLRDLGSTLRYVGPAGNAAEVKALVNMVMNINTAGLAEGLGLGEALGLDLSLLREIFAQTGAASRVLETDGEDMQRRDHDVYFSAAHAAKDSHIALELAREASLTLPLARAAAEQYDRLKELGLGDLDKSAVAELTFRSRRAGHAPGSG